MNDNGNHVCDPTTTAVEHSPIIGIVPERMRVTVLDDSNQPHRLDLVRLPHER